MRIRIRLFLRKKNKFGKCLQYSMLLFSIYIPMRPEFFLWGSGTTVRTSKQNIFVHYFQTYLNFWTYFKYTDSPILVLSSSTVNILPLRNICTTETTIQCCGSGPADSQRSPLNWLSWIRIRISTVLGMRIRIHKHWNWPKFTNKPGFLPFKKAYVPSY